KKNGDVSSLSCVNKGTTGGAIDLTKLTALETLVTTLGTKITNLQNNAPSGGATFVGVTTAAANKLNGNMQNGADNGIVGAAKACNAEFAGSHMCTAYEIYDSVLKAKLSSTTNISSLAWIYFPSWNNPISGSLLPNQG